MKLAKSLAVVAALGLSGVALANEHGTTEHKAETAPKGKKAAKGAKAKKEKAPAAPAEAAPAAEAPATAPTNP